MIAEIDAMRKSGHLGTFSEARRWVRGIKTVDKDTPFDLEFIPPAYYVVTRDGGVIGQGMTYEEAIDNATKEVRASVWVGLGVHFMA